MKRIIAALFLMSSVAACQSGGPIVPEVDSTLSSPMAAVAMYRQCYSGAVNSRSADYDPVDRKAASAIYCLVGDPVGMTFGHFVERRLPTLARYPGHPDCQNMVDRGKGTFADAIDYHVPPLCYMDPRALDEMSWGNTDKAREVLNMWLVLAEAFSSPYTRGSLPDRVSGDAEYLEFPRSSLRPELQGLGVVRARLIRDRNRFQLMINDK